MFKVNADAFARLVEYLAERPRSCQTLSELTGLHYRTVLDYVDALHRRRQIHIAAWMPDSRGCYTIAMYVLGFGQDAAQPVKTPAQRMKAYRERKRSVSPRPKRLPPNSVFALGQVRKG